MAAANLLFRATRAFGTRRMSADFSRLALLLACSILLTAPPLAAAVIPAVWNPGAIGNWGDAANWNTNPVYPNNGVDTFNALINDGQTTLDGAFTVDQLTLAGGALVGPGSVQVKNHTTWSGGAIGGGSATSTLDFNGAATITGGGTITLGDAATISHTAAGAATLGPSVVLNAKNAAVNGGTSGLVNQGTINADGQGMASQVVSVNDVTNANVVNALGGVTLRMGGSWHNGTGTINVNNAKVELGGNFTTADLGTINMLGTPSVALTGTLNNSGQTLGSMFIKGGTIAGGNITGLITVSGPIAATLDGIADFSGFRFDPTPDVESLIIRNSGLTLPGGTLDMSGYSRSIIFEGSTPQFLGGAAQIRLSTPFRNRIQGNVTIGPGINMQGVGFDSTAEVEIAVVKNQGSIVMPGGPPSNAPRFVVGLENQGTIVVGPNVRFEPVQFKQTAGVLTLDAVFIGAAPLQPSLPIEGGTLNGRGTTRFAPTIGTATTGAKLAISPTTFLPAIFGFSGLTIHPLSTVEVKLGGTVAGTSYDRFEVVGAAALAGTLDVKLAGGFHPQLGNSFAVMTFGSRTGDFATYSGMDVGGHLALHPSFTSTSLLLTARPAIDGDINLDGVVDIFDVNAVSAQWGTAGPQGDVNGDGTVDMYDINDISSNWGASGGVSAAPVPEPSSVALAMLGGLAVVRLRRGASRGALRRDSA